MKALYKLVLKGSAISALTLAAAAVGCSDSDSGSGPGAAGAGGDDGNGGRAGSSAQAGKTSSNAGEGAGGDPSGTAGTNSGGTAGTSAGGAGGAGGADGDNVGGETGEAGAAGRPGIGLGEGGSGFGSGGQPGTGTGPSVAKFCNTLSFGDADTTFILEVGTGTDKVTFTATTGECAPADGLACRELPQGEDVPIALFDADDPDTALDEKAAEIGAGEDWIFWNAVPDGQPIIEGQTINQSVATCEDVIYEDIP